MAGENLDPVKDLEEKIINETIPELIEREEPKEEIENLGIIVDKAIEEFVNLKENQEIYPKVEKTIENDIPKEVREQFEELEATIKKDKTKVTTKHISSSEIMDSISRLNNHFSELNIKMSTKKNDKSTMDSLIIDKLEILKDTAVEINNKHNKIWFGYIGLGALLGTAFGMMDHVWLEYIKDLGNLIKLLWQFIKG